VMAYTSQDFAFAKQPTTLSAEARLQGYGARTVTVSLERDGEPVGNRTLTFTDDGRQTARFPVTETYPGLYRFTFSIAPLEGELNTANNKRSVFLRVINDKVKVLLIDARPSWDTKFLSQTLRQDRSVALTSIYRFARSRDYAVTADEKASASGVKLPQSFENLAPYEVVLIGKGFEDLLTERGVELLKRYLLERSGSVVFFRGKADANCEALRDLEPVIWSSEEVRNLQLTLTEEGRQSPLFAFGGGGDPQTVIRQLPSLISATRVQGTRSFSVVLARAESREGSAEEMATVAYQRYGGGRVMVIAGQGLWQWGFLPDELSQYSDVYRTFWSQMLRWLVGGSDFLPGQEFSIKTDRLSYAVGEKVNLLVYAKRKIEPGAALTLEVVQPDGTRVPVSPGPSQSYGAALVGVFTPQQTGDYSAVLRTGPRQADELVAPFTVTPGQQEDLFVAADPQLMRQIAEASGGKVITAEELGRLPDQVREVERRALLREERQSVWDRPWVFLVLCVLLGAEWYVRRRQGLC